MARDRQRWPRYRFYSTTTETNAIASDGEREKADEEQFERDEIHGQSTSSPGTIDGQPEAEADDAHHDEGAQDAGRDPLGEALRAAVPRAGSRTRAIRQPPSPTASQAARAVRRRRACRSTTRDRPRRRPRPR